MGEKGNIFDLRRTKTVGVFQDSNCLIQSYSVRKNLKIKNEQHIINQMKNILK